VSESENKLIGPGEVLFDYFRALLALNVSTMAEALTAKHLGRDLDLDAIRARRATIRDRFCTKRRRVTDGVVAYGPLVAKTYDPANIVVEDEILESATHAQITVKNRVLGEHWKYHLVLRGGQWLIDSMEFREGRKWARVQLH